MSAKELRRCVWLLLPMLLLVLPVQETVSQDAVAQDAVAQDAVADETFFETLNVDIVNVEVFVTDKDGAPVTGLDRDAFRLIEDGKEVEIANFYAVEGGSVAPASTEPATQSEARTPATLPELGPTTEPLHLVVYIDNLFIEPFSRRRAIQATRGFLADRLQPGDQVMVVTSERTLHVRQTFTADRAQVFRTLAEIDEMSGLGVQGGSESQRIRRLIDDAKSYSEAFQLADFHAKETFADLQRSIATLQEMIDLLAGLRGRTAILFVSDGLPMVAAADLFSMVQSKFGKLAGAGAPSLQYDARHRFRELAAAANSRQVTFYTLEAAGLRSHTSLSAEHRSGFSGSQIDVDLTRDFNRQEPLQMLAEATGGLTAINTNNLDGFLDRVAEDFRTYYSLGFAPLHSDDGRLHTLEVNVRDARYQVRHRATYRNRGPDERFVDAVLATLRYGAGKRSSADLNAELKLSAAHPTEGLYAVPFEASVPFREVTFVPQGDTFRGRLDLVIVAIDEAGESSLPQRESLPLSIPAEHMEAVLQEHVVYAAELQMRAGVHYLAVGFRDSISGRTGIVRRGLRVGRN